MLETVLVLWILFGLFNIYVMRKADEAARGNPLFGIYWMKNRSSFLNVVSIVSGFTCLPFTLWAACEWYRLTKRA